MANKLLRTDSKESVYSTSSCVSGVGGWQIGDRARIGEKQGTIAFIGNTNFAVGEWIGLILDEPSGKNDGSIDGMRYFSCIPQHGLFVKAGKLSRIIMSPARYKSSTPVKGKHSSELDFDIGERVLIPGGKVGTLRFFGQAEFANGIWGGIELDQPLGKNDGSVQGKQYFSCKPLFGIFVPAKNIQRIPTPISNQTSIHHNKASVLRTEANQSKKGGSRDSLNSIGRSSIASSRFGLAPRQQRSAYIKSEGDSTIIALQKALEEKERHIEQLLSEREEYAIPDHNLTKKLEDKLKHSEELVQNLKREISSKIKEIDDLRFKIEEDKVTKQCEIEELLQNINKATDNETEIEKSKEETLRLNKEMEKTNTLKTQLEVLENKIKVIHEETATEKLKLKSINEELRIQNQELNMRMLEMEQLIEKEKKELNTQISDFQKLTHEFENTILEKTNTISDMERKSANFLEIIEQKEEETQLYLRKIEKMEVQEDIEQNFRFENESLKNEITKLERAAEDQNELKERWSREQLSLEEKIRNTETQLIQTSSELQNLQEKYNQLEKERQMQSDTFNAECAEVMNQKTNLEKRLAEELIKTKSFQEQAGESMKKENILQAFCEAQAKEIDSIKEEFQSLAANFEAAKQELDVKIRIIAKIEKTNEELQKQLQSSKKELETSLETFKMDENALAHNLSLVKKEVDLKVDKIDSLTKQLTCKEKEIDLYQMEIKKLKEQMTSTSNTISMIEESSTEMTEKLKDDHAKEVEDFVRKQEDLKKDIQKANQLIDQLKTVNAKHESELAEKSDRIEALVKQNEELKSTQNKINEKNQQLSEIEVLSSNYQKALEEKEKQLLEIQETLKVTKAEAHNETKELRQQYEAAKEGNASNIVQIRKKDEKISNQEEELEKINTILKEKDAKVDDLERELNVAIKHNDENRKKLLLEIEEVITERNRIQEKFNTVNKELYDNKLTIDNLTLKITEIEKELEQKKRETNILANSAEENFDNKKLLEQQLQQLEKQIEDTNNKDKQNYEQKETEFMEALKLIDRLKKEKSDLVKDLEITKDEMHMNLSQLTEKAQTASNKAAEAERQKEIAEEMRDSLMVKNMQLAEEIDSLQTKDIYNEVKLLRKIVATKEDEVGDLKRQLEKALIPPQLFDGGIKKKVVPTRIYCDMCEQFDLHDTTDCPRQAMDSLETTSHSHHSPCDGKKKKKLPRDYCDICEEFDHKTENCSKQKKKRDYTF